MLVHKHDWDMLWDMPAPVYGLSTSERLNGMLEVILGIMALQGKGGIFAIKVATRVGPLGSMAVLAGASSSPGPYAESRYLNTLGPKAYKSHLLWGVQFENKTYLHIFLPQATAPHVLE